MLVEIRRMDEIGRVRFFHGQPCMKQVFLRSLYPYSHGCFPRTTHIWGASLSHRNSFLRTIPLAPLESRTSSRWLHSAFSAHDHAGAIRALLRMQYAYMLRYLFLPSSQKPLTSLDKSPLLWRCNNQRHPREFLGGIDRWSWNIEARFSKSSKFSGFWLIC